MKEKDEYSYCKSCDGQVRTSGRRDKMLLRFFNVTVYRLRPNTVFIIGKLLTLLALATVAWAYWLAPESQRISTSEAGLFVALHFMSWRHFSLTERFISLRHEWEEDVNELIGQAVETTIQAQIQHQKAASERRPPPTPGSS